MDVVNFDALKAQNRIIQRSDVNPDEDYFILGHYDPRRKEFKATDYPIYAIKAGDVLGPIINNQDRKFINSTLVVSTTNDTYIDLTNMSLTTSELGTVTQPALGNYQIHFSATYNLSDTGSTGEFILNVNGVDVTASQINEAPMDTNTHRTNLIWQIDNVAVNTIIKIRFKVTPETPSVSYLAVESRSLMINGVNIETVV